MFPKCYYTYWTICAFHELMTSYNVRNPANATNDNETLIVLITCWLTDDVQKRPRPPSPSAPLLPPPFFTSEPFSTCRGPAGPCVHLRASPGGHRAFQALKLWDRSSFRIFSFCTPATIVGCQHQQAPPVRRPSPPVVCLRCDVCVWAVLAACLCCDCVCSTCATKLQHDSAVFLFLRL